MYLFIFIIYQLCKVENFFHIFKLLSLSLYMFLKLSCHSKFMKKLISFLVNSFTTLGKLLLVEGAEYILSEKFCQDPLEEYFGKQRMRLGCNDNPMLIEYNSNALGLNVAGDNLIRVFGSNTKGRKDEFQMLDVNDTDLPSSKKQKK